jgi:hypothetical protein
MSQNSVAFYSQQYTSSVELLAQQLTPRVAGFFDQMSCVGEGATVVDQIEAIAVQERTTRFDPIVPLDPKHIRPWVYPKGYDAAVMFDTFDKMKMNASPESAYVQELVAAMNRQEDDTAIAAFFADRLVNVNNASTPSTEIFPVANAISADVGGTASGANVEKLQTAIQFFEEKEVDLDMEQIYVVIPPSARRHLMNEIEVSSGDFFKGEVMRTRSINGFLSMNFIVSNRLKKDGANNWRCPIFTKKGLTFARWGARRTDVTQRKDIRGLPWQAYEDGYIGAVRKDNNRVLEMKISSTV